MVQWTVKPLCIDSIRPRLQQSIIIIHYHHNYTESTD